MNNLHSKKILQRALKDAGLPYSYPTLLRYERKQIIKRPSGEIRYADRSWRFYSNEEIVEIISILKKLLNK